MINTIRSFDDNEDVAQVTMYEDVEKDDCCNCPTQEEKRTLSIETVLNDIKAGLSRKDIAYKYNMNSAEKNMVFNHPRIKGVRKSAPVRFELVD